MIWLTGGALAVALAMIIGLLALVLVRGLSTFWPQPLVQLTTVDGTPLLGEITQTEIYRPSDQLLAEMPAESAMRLRAEMKGTGGTAMRRLVRTGNYDLAATHFRWIDEALITDETRPCLGSRHRAIVVGAILRHAAGAARRRAGHRHDARRGLESIRRVSSRRARASTSAGPAGKSMNSAP